METRRPEPGGGFLPLNFSRGNANRAPSALERQFYSTSVWVLKSASAAMSLSVNGSLSHCLAL